MIAGSMSRSLPKICRFAALAAICTALAPGSWAASGEPGIKRALLIGINNYAAVPGLKGSVNDVMTMREILIQRWGFSPERITMLIDEQASRDNMVAALERIVRESGPQDTVYIHYSGHGSQVEDLNGDEEDGLDETLVPQNGRTAGVRDIVDDELDEMFAKFRTTNVLIVLDSCHSGTATRAFNIRARSVPQDKRIDLYKEAPKARAIVPRKESRFVVMSATSEKDEALDGPIQGRYHGFFSYALANALSAAPANATATQVFNSSLQELKRVQEQFGRIAMPDPQLEGPPAQLEQPLLGIRLLGPANAYGGESPRLAWAAVKPSGNSEWLLVKGAILGATPGSTWSIYPPGETRFAAGGAIAVARVSLLNGDDAVASLISSNVAIPAEARAVTSMPSTDSPRVAVRIQAPTEVRRRQVRDLVLKNSSAIDLVGSDAPARYIIDVGDTALRLLAADGLQTVGQFDAGNDRWAADAARIIERSLKASELSSLDNPASQLKVSVSVISASQPATRDIVLVANTQPSRLRVRAGGDARASSNSLQLAVGVNKNAYLTIVDVDPEGSVNVLFPNNSQRPEYLPQGFVKGGDTALIPDSLTPQNAAGFYWDYSPPKGMDTLRVFACTDLASAEAIRRRLASIKTAAQTPGVDPLWALHDDLQRMTARGIRIEASAPSSGAAGSPSSSPSAADWAAASVSVLIQD
jgi:Caspase domain/Domain of unknown function (DUF4384)